MPSRPNKNNSRKTPRPSKEVAIAQQSTELVKVDPEFLQALRIYWQLGDWTALEASSTHDIQANEARAEWALYIATACFQLGLLEKGKTYHGLALQWGASKRDIGRALISGVYNNLAAASLLTEKHASSALQHFVTAAKIALPGRAATAVVKARTQNQLERLNNYETNTALAISQLISSSSNINEASPTESIKNSLAQDFLFDEKLKIWRRSTGYQFSYTDGDEIEQRILTAVQSCGDVSVFSRELLDHQIDWASEYHLSADRVNLLRPFTEQLKNKTVLELGCGCGAITRFLGESGANVIAIEGSQQRASIAAERCRDLGNVTIVLDKLQDAPFSQQFDVVTLIGVLEYSRIYVNADDPIQYVLEKVRSYLKPNGILIVAIENQLGLKYFAGAPEDHGVGVMAGINDLYRAETPVTFGKKELQQRFIQAGFSNSDTYLALPDYKLPGVIVHPRGYQHHDHFDLGNLLASTVFYDRQGIVHPLFSLESSWPLICRNGLTADLANSHLFIAHNTTSTWQQSDDILVSYYSPKRGAETNQEVTFYLQGEDVLVKRKQVNKTDAAAATVTTEPYVNGVLHSQLLHKIVQRPGWTLQQVEQWLQLWLDALEQAQVNRTSILEGWPDYDKWLPENYIDAIPRNLVVSDKGYNQFIDLEWALTHQLPLPLVLYRGLLVTLSTITSIAPPADSILVQRQQLLDALMFYCGYSLTASDYQIFVPVMEALSRKAQGLAPTSATSTQAIMLTPFPVRQSAGTIQDHSNCMTLYWRLSDTSFCEEHTVKYQYSVSSEKQHIAIPIPAQQMEYSRFRLDIGERPGCYQVAELKFSDSTNNVLWQWDFDIRHLSNVGQLGFYQAIGQNTGICLISNGYDPQFELHLPQEVLTALAGGGSLTIELLSYT